MDDHDGDQDQGECTACARAGGLLLLGLAGILAWMGADLLTGGALTRLVAGGAAIGAAAAAAGAAGDNEGQEVAGSDDSA